MKAEMGNIGAQSRKDCDRFENSPGCGRAGKSARQAVYPVSRSRFAIQRLVSAAICARDFRARSVADFNWPQAARISSPRGVRMGDA